MPGATERLKPICLLAALLLYVAPSELWLVQAICTDSAVLWNLAAWALATAPRSPAFLHWRFLGRLVSGNWLDGLDRGGQGLGIF